MRTSRNATRRGYPGFPSRAGKSRRLEALRAASVWYALTQDASRIFWLTPLNLGSAAKDGTSSATILGAPLSDAGRVGLDRRG